MVKILICILISIFYIYFKSQYIKDNILVCSTTNTFLDAVILCTIKNKILKDQYNQQH